MTNPAPITEKDIDLSKQHLVCGRITGDDEDTVCIVEARSTGDAYAIFENKLKEDNADVDFDDEDTHIIVVICEPLIESLQKRRLTAMKQLVTAVGELRYGDDNAFFNAIRILENGGWLVKNIDGTYTMTSGEEHDVIYDDAVNKKNKSILFPYSNYWDIPKVMKEIITESTAGEFYYYCVEDGLEMHFWEDGAWSHVTDFKEILSLSGTAEDMEVDALTMESEKAFENKWQSDDYNDIRDHLMGTAFNAYIDRLPEH